MAIYAIGDIQGCFDAFRQLLDKIKFDPNSDQIWIAGDLVNRGPKSLETLRFIKNLGDAAVSVLGNHDIHLIASAHRLEKPRKKDTFEDLWAAPDFAELIHWLRQQPLIHCQGNTVMVHAGISPNWNLEEARSYAKEVETILSSDQHGDFIDHLYGDQPSIWSNSLTGWDRLRYITNCLTRLRYCDLEGNMDFNEKNAPGKQPYGLVPWFEHPARKDPKESHFRIIFGHWSTLGLIKRNNCFCLDTGCLWGGTLTAMNIDSLETYSVACDCYKQPK